MKHNIRIMVIFEICLWSPDRSEHHLHCICVQHFYVLVIASSCSHWKNEIGNASKLIGRSFHTTDTMTTDVVVAAFRLWCSRMKNRAERKMMAGCNQRDAQGIFIDTPNESRVHPPSTLERGPFQRRLVCLVGAVKCVWDEKSVPKWSHRFFKLYLLFCAGRHFSLAANR